jgi:hypothetical protein
MEAVVLQQVVPDYLQNPIADFVAFLPQLLGALVILVIGWLVGRAVARVVTRLSDRVGLDDRVRQTPLGRVLGGARRGVSQSLGTLGAWFVYALAFLAAADTLAIPTLSNWLATAVSYLPAFVGGLLVITLGFVVADFIGDVIMRTQAAAESAYVGWFATGTRMFLYFTAVVIGLDTMGVNVDLLYVFANAVAWGLAAAFAIGVGVAAGWGSKDYVRQHIGQWVPGEAVPTGGPGTGGGAGSAPPTAGAEAAPSGEGTEAAETPAEERGLGVAQVHSEVDEAESDLNEEYVIFENAGEEPMELGGSTVSDREGNSYTLPEGFVLQPGQTVTLHSGSGSDTDEHLYWNAESRIWDDESDEVRVYDPDNRLVLQESYG